MPEVCPHLEGHVDLLTLTIIAGIVAIIAITTVFLGTGLLVALILTSEHVMVAFGHVSAVLSSLVHLAQVAITHMKK